MFVRHSNEIAKVIASSAMLWIMPASASDIASRNNAEEATIEIRPTVVSEKTRSAERHPDSICNNGKTRTLCYGQANHIDRNYHRQFVLMVGIAY